jgi:hypothetical protein
MALRDHGTNELTARLAAEVGMLAFAVASERWMKSGDGEPYLPCVATALGDLQERAAELDSRLGTSRMAPAKQQ